MCAEANTFFVRQRLNSASCGERSSDRFLHLERDIATLQLGCDLQRLVPEALRRRGFSELPDFELEPDHRLPALTLLIRRDHRPVDVEARHIRLHLLNWQPIKRTCMNCVSIRLFELV